MIIFEEVSFGYANESIPDSIPAVERLNFSISQGECVGLIGKSGCGKSTVLKLMNGIIPHMLEGDLSGRIEVVGQNPTEQSIQELSAQVGSIFQNPKSQFFHLNTTDEIMFGAVNHGAPKQEILDRLTQTRQAFSLDHLLDRNIFRLSGGEKQRIACASVYTNQPAIYLMDEPSSNLDAAGIESLRQVLEVLKRQGHTIVIAEHRLYYLMGLCDRFFYLENGQMAGELSPDEMQALAPAKRADMGLRSLVLPVLTNHQAPIADHRPSLRLIDLGAAYRKKKVIDIAQCHFRENEVTAVIGKNGAGKSTLAKALCGLIPTTGTISKGDQPLSKRQRNKQFFMVMQDVNHQLFSESVLDDLFLGHKVDPTSEERALEILEALDLLPMKDLHPLALSGGQKQRVAIASAIFSDCQYLIFDEPTSGLDHCHMMQFAALIERVKHRVKSILIITHDIELIQACCDAVVELDELVEAEQSVDK